jgi:preprotein translocase subunit SecG
MFANNDFNDLTAEFVRNPSQLIGIPLAIVGAVFLSLGAQFQHRGVTKVESTSGSDATSGLSIRQLKLLLTRPSWVLGTLMLGFAIAFQLSALAFSPQQGETESRECHGDFRVCRRRCVVRHRCCSGRR